MKMHGTTKSIWFYSKATKFALVVMEVNQHINVGSYGWNSFLAYLQFCQQEVAMPGKKVKITAATHHLNGALEI